MTSSSTGERTIWGIHAGRFGEADNLFLKKKCIAIGWSEMDDLGVLKADIEVFKTEVKKTYPDMKAGAIPGQAGQLFRFVHMMKKNDLVIYPSKMSKNIYIGEIVGPYSYKPEVNADYPNMREVKWLKDYPRTHFKQGALYEIGSALTLFQVKNYADEFLAVLAGVPEAPSVEEEDETVAYVAEEIEQTTRDYIIKRIAQELKGHPFADFVAQLLNTMGFRTRVSPPGPDGGIDILAHKDELGFEPPIVKVQVKSTEGTTGDPAVAQLYGKVSPGEYGLFVTLGGFSSQAISFAKSKSNLRLIDGDELVNMVLQHYEQFDAKYKGMIPLKKIYIPEALEKSVD